MQVWPWMLVASTNANRFIVCDHSQLLVATYGVRHLYQNVCKMPIFRRPAIAMVYNNMARGNSLHNAICGGCYPKSGGVHSHEHIHAGAVRAWHVAVPAGTAARYLKVPTGISVSRYASRRALTDSACARCPASGARFSALGAWRGFCSTALTSRLRQGDMR